jgi:predicted nucleic acid-binding protein
MTAAADLVFFDTNVLLYTLDAGNSAKQAMALEWRNAGWELRVGRLSWQVLNEFYANATGKMKASPAIARTMVDSYACWQAVDFSLGLIHNAWHWVDHAGVSYWDALIVAAAERSGCRWLLTEDFQEGRKFGAIQVVNPFRTKPAKIFRG